MDRSRFNKVTEQFRTLSLKERVGAVLAAVAVCYGLWDFLLVQPMIAKEKSLTEQVVQKNQQLLQASEQISKMSGSEETKDIAENQQRLKNVIEQLQVTDERLKDIASNLIPPEQMVDVLKELLAQSEGLSIRRLEGLGATPFPEPDPLADMVNPFQSIKAWRHGLRIEFSGSYLATLNYLKTLENLKWRFHWDSVELDADDYPTVNTAIKIYTLSFDEEWIGV